MPITAESLRVEESRIQEAYARRRRGDLYSCFNRAHLLLVQEREKRFLHLFSRYGCVPLTGKKILEIGCGTGELLREFIKWGARPQNIVGIDLLPERVAEAIELCPKSVEIQQANAAELQFPDNAFDVVVQSTVFTSVLDAQIKRQIASEMRRVLRPDGIIIWYDYFVNNPRNPDVRGVKRREIHAIFPQCEIRLQRIILAPPISRLLAPYSWLLCYLLSKLPWLCTHYIGVIRKPAVADRAEAPCNTI